MTEKEYDDQVFEILQHPEEIGREVGFKELTPMHGNWIRAMVRGNGDYTLQAHRGSYKSSCLAVAIGLLMIICPDRNIIFIRKADNDVSEMLGMVQKIDSTFHRPASATGGSLKRPFPLRLEKWENPSFG